MINSNHMKRRVRLLLRNRLAVVGIAVALLVLIGGGRLLLDVNPIPLRYRSGLSYGLYYPKQLPDGYQVKQGSFQRKGSVLIFTLSSPRGRAIAVSEEALPVGLNLSQSNSSGMQLPTDRNFTTGIGQASLSLWGANTVVSIQAGGTWLILNVSGVDPQTAIAIGSSFKPV